MLLTPDFADRDALLDALGHHPYAQLTAGGEAVTGYRDDDTLVWTAQGPGGPVAASVGDGAAASLLFAALARAGALDGIRWLHLPRVDRETAARHLPVVEHDDWDYQWTTADPAPHPGEAQVVVLTEADTEAVEAVLDDALPHSTSRPSDARIRRWYGIREGDRLVAVAGDRSVNGVGFLAGVAVASDRQGRGLGAALTTALTRALIAEFGVCSLGVMSDNHGAIRLYERIGYTGRISRSSVALG